MSPRRTPLPKFLPGSGDEHLPRRSFAWTHDDDGCRHTQQTPGRAVASKCQHSAETIICFRCGREQGDLVDGWMQGPNGGGVKIVTVRASTLVELLT